jgi:FkbM family methyltransferase
MLLKSGLRYLRREGFTNFTRRFLIFFILEWYSRLLTLFKYKSKDGIIVREIQGSKMCLDIRDKGVSRELALVGVREALFTRTLQGALREGDCVVDIGANIGYYALMEARLLGPRGRVYAVEPVPHNMELLEKSVALNNYSNIETFPIGIGSSNTTATMYISDHPNWCSFYPPTKIIDRKDVKISSLDSFLKDKQRPDLIRMDVEGYEYEILTGMSGVLDSGVPLKLLIEFHPDIMGPERAAAFLTNLKKNGFQLKKVILEPNIYPPCSRALWWLVELLNQRVMKMKFGAREMTLDELMAYRPIMSGRAGDPALYLERDGDGS